MEAELEIVSVKEAKAGLSEYLNRAAYGHKRIVIASRGKAKAALVSIDDLRRLEDMERREGSQMLARAIAETTEFEPLDKLIAELRDTDEA